MRFNLKAYRGAAGVSTVQVDAADSLAAKHQLEVQGYTVLSVRPAQLFKWSLTRREKFSAPLFGQQLLALLDAGLGIVESIDLLHSKARPGVSRTILGELHRRLSEGSTFSRALEALAASFPALFVATVRASERTGDLPEALRRYIEYERKVNVLQDKVVAASVYPMVLVVVGGLVVLFLLGYVVPKFSKVYEDVGQDKLPALSKLLMLWGQVVSDHLSLLVMAFIALAGAAAWVLKQPGTRSFLEQRLWRFNVVGEYFKIYQLARFTRTISMLLKGGIPLVAALQMADELLRQPALRQGLGLARQAISEGKSVSSSFSEQGLATDIGVRLLMVGERSGELGSAMERVAAFYDDEIARAVEWFSRLFEPILMLVIGFMIGGIVILMYLPIFELASSVQ